jgi:hypothetical protein
MGKAQKIWEAFKGELIVEPSDDMREALATAFREIVDEFEYYADSSDSFGCMVINSQDLSDLADQLEELV